MALAIEHTAEMRGLADRIKGFILQVDICGQTIMIIRK